MSRGRVSRLAVADSSIAEAIKGRGGVESSMVVVVVFVVFMVAVQIVAT